MHLAPLPSRQASVAGRGALMRLCAGGLSSQKEHSADEEGEEEDVACRGAECLVELPTFGLL